MLITTQEWLALTRSVSKFWTEAEEMGKDYAIKYNRHLPNRVRPKIECADGFKISIQAGEGLYCKPYANLEDGMYETVELGYPNQAEPDIMDYAEDPDEPTGTVYAQVPVEIVDKIIVKHGGIVNVEEVNKYLRSENK